MIIAYIELESPKLERYEYKIVTEKDAEDFYSEPAIIHVDANLSQELIKAHAYNKKEISINNQQFKIISLCTNEIFDELCQKIKPKTVDFTKLDKPTEIYVYKKTSICPKCKANNRSQNLENVIATISCLLNINDTCEIELQFCKNCNYYFIEEQSLDEYEKKHGLLLFERRRDFNTSSDYNFEFSKDTILSRYGYVAQSNVLSLKERRSILIFLMEKGYKNEIKNLLSSFIFYRGDKCYKAKPIWESDLDFVNHYNNQNERYIGYGKLKF